MIWHILSQPSEVFNTRNSGRQWDSLLGYLKIILDVNKVVLYSAGCKIFPCSIFASVACKFVWISAVLYKKKLNSVLPVLEFCWKPVYMFVTSVTRKMPLSITGSLIYYCNMFCIKSRNLFWSGISWKHPSLHFSMWKLKFRFSVTKIRSWDCMI